MKIFLQHKHFLHAQLEKKNLAAGDTLGEWDMFPKIELANFNTFPGLEIFVIFSLLSA